MRRSEKIRELPYCDRINSNVEFVYTLFIYDEDDPPYTKLGCEWSCSGSSKCGIGEGLKLPDGSLCPNHPSTRRAT